MKGIISQYELTSAKNMQHAMELLAQQKTLKAFAGGTDLMVLYESGKLSPGHYLSLHELSELKGIQFHNQFVEIGALTTFGEIRRHLGLQKEFPLLTRAAGEIGAWAIQNRATIGGNIANASPAADSPPALLCHDAIIVLEGLNGLREVPYCQFHLDYKKTQLAPGELIRALKLPRVHEKNRRVHASFKKIGTRRYQAISKVCFSGLVHVENRTIITARLAWGSVAPVPKRTMVCENLLSGMKTGDLDALFLKNLGQELQKEISPIDDIRSTARYRRQVAQNLLNQFIKELGAGYFSDKN